jgi:hypothetical protein
MATNVKILLRRGLRNEITADTLDAGELGYTTDTNQLFVGTADSSDEIVFDPFANAHAVIQSYLNLLSAPLNGLEVDEDLVISISTIHSAGAFVVGTEYTIVTPGNTDFTLIGAADSVAGTVFTATGVGTGTGTAKFDGVALLLADMETNGGFNVEIFGRARTNTEVLTEKSFSQLYANIHLESHAAATGLRSDLFKKELNANDTTEGTFLKYAASDSTSFFIDYSLKQTDTTNTFVRVGTIRVINGEAITPPLTGLVKLTDDNTEIWQDDGDGTAEADEFSNIEFTSVIDGTDMKINYTQDANFTTEISYTVKRWTM